MAAPETLPPGGQGGDSAQPAGLRGTISHRGGPLPRTLRTARQDTVELREVVEQLRTTRPGRSEVGVDRLDQSHLEVAVARSPLPTGGHPGAPILELPLVEEEREEG